VALVQGSAFGGGVGLLACCDVVVAVQTARFALSEVRLGMVPATISPYVIDKIGLSQARRFFVTGERFDASTAKRYGLVSEVSRLPVFAEFFPKTPPHTGDE
jgi:methylglutaconyl-CoA hydratase